MIDACKLHNNYSLVQYICSNNKSDLIPKPAFLMEDNCYQEHMSICSCRYVNIMLRELTAIDLEETSRALSVLVPTFQLGRGMAILVWRGPCGVFFLKITSLSMAGLGLVTL
jgi:hypothetical protein